MRANTTSMTAWKAILAVFILLGQQHSSPSSNGISGIVVQAAAIANTLHNDVALLEERNPEAKVYQDIPQSRNRRQKRNPRPIALAPQADVILVDATGLLVDVLAPAIPVPTSSSSSSSLPWCSDISTSTSSITSSTTTTTTSSSSLNTATMSDLITSSSAGEAICIAMPTSSTSSSTSSIPSPSSPTTSSREGVQTIVFSPSNSGRTATSARARSTRTVTAVQTLQRQQQATPSTTTTVVEATSTVVVFSTTTYLNTVYTTITPRPTAAFLTS